jgi:signal transduction histidine kinase
MRSGTFRQVLLNLLDNAVKYGPVDQTVRVRITEGGGRGAAGGRTVGHFIRVAVIDEGPGVPVAERESIWRPFQRGSAARDGAGGSGIGLTVVKEILDEHGGRAWVEDAGGRGATFVVELPVAGRGARGAGRGELRIEERHGGFPHPAPRAPRP